MSLSEYYRVHHGLSVKRRNQKLIRIASAHREVHMLQPGGEPVADGKKRSYRSYKGRIIEIRKFIHLVEDKLLMGG